MYIHIQLLSSSSACILRLFSTIPSTKPLPHYLYSTYTVYATVSVIDHYDSQIEHNINRINWETLTVTDSQTHKHTHSSNLIGELCEQSANCDALLRARARAFTRARSIATNLECKWKLKREKPSKVYDPLSDRHHKQTPLVRGWWTRFERVRLCPGCSQRAFPTHSTRMYRPSWGSFTHSLAHTAHATQPKVPCVTIVRRKVGCYKKSRLPGSCRAKSSIGICLEVPEKNHI